jgi:3-hydroxyisobutyrate dehydrogenase
MGTRSGLDAATLSEILKASSGKNWSVEVYNPYPGVMPAAPASKGYAPGFTCDLMVKDLKLASATAAEIGFANPLGTRARELYEEHQAAGSGALDFSSILQKLADDSKR